MAVEVEIETLVQDRLVDLADAALPGPARISTKPNVDAAKVFDDLVEPRLHRGGIGDVAANRKRRAAARLGDKPRAASFHVESATSAPAAANALAVASADRARGAGARRDLAGERNSSRRRAWPAPATSIRNRTYRLPRSIRNGRRFRVGDGFRPQASARSASILASFLGTAEDRTGRDRAPAHAGQRIEHRLDDAASRIVACEVAPVVSP